MQSNCQKFATAFGACRPAKRSLRQLACAFLLTHAFPCFVMAQDADPATNVRLSPEVIVDTTQGEAYLTSPEGGVAAVELAEGRQLWRSTAAAKPLAVAGDHLIGQVESATPENKLGIATLDRRQGGRSISEKSVALPEGVIASAKIGPTQAFRAQAEVSDGEANVSWEYEERPLRGMPTGPRKTLPGERARESKALEKETEAPDSGSSRAARAPVVRKGMFRLDLESGAVTPRAAESATPRAAVQPSSSFAHLAGVPEPQFLSADGRHVLSSTRVGDDSVLEKYLWTIYNRDTKERLGEFRSQVSFTPFVVSQSKVIFVTQPFASRSATAMVEQPLQVRAVDLASGRELWSQPVRDTTDRSPPPP